METFSLVVGIAVVVSALVSLVARKAAPWARRTRALVAQMREADSVRDALGVAFDSMNSGPMPDEEETIEPDFDELPEPTDDQTERS